MKRFNSVDVGVADMCLKNIARRFASMSLMVIMILIHFPVATVYMAGMDTVPSDGDYFISPDGDDSNPGTYEKPFRTIEKARNTIRKKTENGQEKDIIVYVRGGKYYREEPLVFLPNHSGKDGHYIVYRAFPGETPEIIGGRIVSDWELHEAHGEEVEVVVKVNSSNRDKTETETSLVESGVKKSFFRRILECILDFFRRLFSGSNPVETSGSNPEGLKDTTVKVQPGIYEANVGKGFECNTMFENGERSVLARTPNEGYILTKGAEVGNTTRIMYYEGDLPKEFDYRDVTVYIWGGSHGELKSNWVPDINPVTDIDFESGTMGLRDHLTYKAAEGIRYYVQGSRDFLDHPGEFYLDKKEGILYYWPRNYPIESQEIIVPTTDRVLYIQGTVSQHAANLRFEGLKFTISNFGSSFSGPSRLENEAMVFIDNANNITIKDCVISNAGYNAISLSNYAQENTIYGNLIENFGLHGVSLWSTYGYNAANIKSAEQGYINKNNIISNNIIRNGGQSVGHGTGIHLVNSGDNQITHNMIHNMPRQGIALSGTSFPYMELMGKIYGVPITWENHFDFAYVRNNRIAYNHIFDVMNDASDGGGINLFGTGKGNIIENNYLHDIVAVPGGVCVGIYLDDASNYTTVRNNILERIGNENTRISRAIVLKGVNVVCENNIIANSMTTAAIHMVTESI